MAVTSVVFIQHQRLENNSRRGSTYDARLGHEYQFFMICFNVLSLMMQQGRGLKRLLPLGLANTLLPYAPGVLFHFILGNIMPFLACPSLRTGL